jgi:hypothetical protein
MNQPLFQVIDAQGRIVGNYLSHGAARALVEHLQVNEGYMGTNRVTVQSMPEAN